MKTSKEQKPDVEIVQAVDVELNEEQLDVVAGGVMDRGDGTGCISPVFPIKPVKPIQPISLPDIFLPFAPDVDGSF